MASGLDTVRAPAEPGPFTCKQRLLVLEVPSKYQAQHRPLVTNRVERRGNRSSVLMCNWLSFMFCKMVEKL